MLTKDDVRKLVEKMILQSTQREVAKKIGVSMSYLNDYLHGRRDLGPTFFRGLGLEKVILYRHATKKQRTVVR